MEMVISLFVCFFFSCLTWLQWYTAVYVWRISALWVDVWAVGNGNSRWKW